MQGSKRGREAKRRGSLEERGWRAALWNADDGRSRSLQVLRIVEVGNQNIAVLQRTGAGLEVVLDEGDAVTVPGNGDVNP
ncbi:MAG TPA: hypothetical protein VKH40_13050 [Alloacidobacterium sp.]|nr:hypothetical protein [Alloacidobacterium sp.]